MIQKYSPIFICGMSRGGTTWIGHCLNEHPDVAVFGESLYWGRNFVRPTCDDGCYTEPEARLILSKVSQDSVAFIGEGAGYLRNISLGKWQTVKDLDLPVPCTPASLFEAICRWIAGSEKVDYVIEKTPHHVDWIPRIRTAFSDAKFVIMLRDPYGFMLSYKHQGDRKPVAARRHFERFYHPLGCAYVWKRYMRSIAQARIDHGTALHMVDFKLLKQSPDEVWEGLLKFLNLPMVPISAVEEQNSSFTGNKHELEPVDVFWMNFIAGRELARAGYAKHASGVHLREVFYSLLGLIPWSIYVIRRLWSSVSGSLLKYLLKKS